MVCGGARHRAHNFSLLIERRSARRTAIGRVLLWWDRGMGAACCWSEKDHHWTGQFALSAEPTFVATHPRGSALATGHRDVHLHRPSRASPPSPLRVGTKQPPRRRPGGTCGAADGGAHRCARRAPGPFLKNPQPTWRFSRQFRASCFPDQAGSIGPERSRGVRQSRPACHDNRLQIGAIRLYKHKRKGRDSNPGDRSRGLTVFKTAAFNRSATLPAGEMLRTPLQDLNWVPANAAERWPSG
jgi:hypothetical protein